MHLSLNLILEEPLQLSNLIVVEVEIFDETCDGDGCHPKWSFEISNYNHPQTMQDVVQDSKFDSTILESSGTYHGVEALQILLMIMSGPHDSGKPPKLNQT